MFTLGVLLALVLGVGLFIAFAIAIVGFVFKVILLPIHIGFWLLKGVFGLIFGLLAAIFFLPLLGLALPILLLPLLLPILLIALIVWLVKRTAAA